MRARPLGTPRPRPAEAGAARNASASGHEDKPAELGSFSGFGAGEFNFTKLLDDAPDDTAGG
jgi:hypothetical protein